MTKILVLLFYALFLILPLQSNNSNYYYFKQISIKEGLPSPITSIYEAHDGLVWIGTHYGLFRFDGEKLKRYSLPGSNSESVFIYKVRGNKQGSIWVFTQEGVNRYNPQKDAFELFIDRDKKIKAHTIFFEKNRIIFPLTDTLLVYKEPDKFDYIPLTPQSGVIISKLVEYNNQFYLALLAKQGKIVLIDKLNGKIAESPFNDQFNISDIYRDSQSQIWVVKYGKGANCYTIDGRLINTFNTQNSGLNNDLILSIEERNSQIWLATDGGGINIISPENREVTVISNEKDLKFPANSVTFLQNGENNMWVGMVREGVLGMKENFITTYSKVPKNNRSGLSEKCSTSLLEDKGGIIWISTDGEGVNRFDPQTEMFTHYPETFGDKIVSICEFSDSELLMSNYNKGFYLFNKKTGKKREFIVPDKEIKEQITRGGTINLYVNHKKEIEFHGASIYSYSPTENKIKKISLPDRSYRGQWYFIGEYKSKSYFHNSFNIFFYDRETNTYQSVSIEEERHILSAYIDKTGRLWVASRNGLKSIDTETLESNDIKLPDDDDIATSLIMDREGILWIGTQKVLYAYFPDEERFIIFSETDGVLPNHFLPKPVLVTRDDNVYMGGTMGLVRINKSLNPHYTINEPKLSLLEIQLNGVNTIPNYQSIIPLLKVPANFTSLTIRSKLDNADIFSKRIYQCRIEGLNDDFIQSSRPYLTIQTLPPGKYTITARCTQADGLWSPLFTLLNIEVLPPWWQHPLFIVSMVIVILAFIAYVFYRREKQMQHILKEKEREIYKEKVQVLININHELRTPLTLLYSPLKQLMHNQQIPNEIRKRLQKTFKQARQMRNIVNMILNLRKAEVGQNTIHLIPRQFNSWLQTIIDDFKSEFEIRDITLLFDADPQIGTVSFDVDQCEIIISNLLMNTYKFSSPGSTVIVSTQLVEEGRFICIKVQDEGIGICEEDIENLFTRYHQGRHTIQGTGIGLSYVKQLVEMHGGKVGAMNNDEKGASFFFTLPYQQKETDITLPSKSYLNEVWSVSEILSEDVVSDNSNFHSVLIVEDDPDLLDYLSENLQSIFEVVYKARDGMEALPIVTSQYPQLVISDIIMPRMNGLQLCHKIKQNPEINYIPVILLTSQAEDSTTGLGYKAGADAYIPKPFDINLLMFQIRNILNRGRIIRKHYNDISQNRNTINPNIENPKDNHFIALLNKVISENLNNPALDVNMVARLMHMGRASLYNKMKLALGIGVNEYINKQRISHAVELLINTEMSINEISEQTGFLHQRNFSTTFKNTMGDSPSSYRMKNKV